MPKVELRELTPQEQALAARVGELLRGAKPGETVTLPPDLAQALDDAARSAAAPAILARRRLEWLHSRDACNVDGYEWGIFRVKWENGRAAEVWQTSADFSDLDAAMASRGVPVGYDGVTTHPEFGAAAGVIVTGEAQQPGETYLAYLARCEREGRNPKPQAKDQDLCREPGCTNPTKTPVSAWCREHDRAGGFPHA